MFITNITRLSKCTGVNAKAWVDVLPQALQEDQTGQIEALEREIGTLRGQHSAAISQLKASYLAEKKAFEMSSKADIAETAKQANRVGT